MYDQIIFLDINCFFILSFFLSRHSPYIDWILSKGLLHVSCWVPMLIPIIVSFYHSFSSIYFYYQKCSYFYFSFCENNKLYEMIFKKILLVFVWCCCLILATFGLFSCWVATMPKWVLWTKINSSFLILYILVLWWCWLAGLCLWISAWLCGLLCCEFVVI